MAKKLAITEATRNLVPNSKAEALFSDAEKKALQMDYMWTTWENSQFHNVAPNSERANLGLNYRKPRQAMPKSLRSSISSSPSVMSSLTTKMRKLLRARP